MIIVRPVLLYKYSENIEIAMEIGFQCRQAFAKYILIPHRTYVPRRAGTILAVTSLLHVILIYTIRVRTWYQAYVHTYYIYGSIIRDLSYHFYSYDTADVLLLYM